MKAGREGSLSQRIRVRSGAVATAGGQSLRVGYADGAGGQAAGRNAQRRGGNADGKCSGRRQRGASAGLAADLQYEAERSRARRRAEDHAAGGVQLKAGREGSLSQRIRVRSEAITARCRNTLGVAHANHSVGKTRRSDGDGRCLWSGDHHGIGVPHNGRCTVGGGDEAGLDREGIGPGDSGRAADDSGHAGPAGRGQAGRERPGADGPGRQRQRGNRQALRVRHADRTTRQASRADGVRDLGEQGAAR